MMSYKQYLKREGYSKSTIIYQLQVLERFSTWAEKENIAPETASYTDILAYVQYCQQQGAGKTGTSRYLTAIKNYYNYLVSIGAIQGNPAESIKLQGLNRKKLYDILSPSELLILYQQYNRRTPTSQWTYNQQRSVAIAGLFIFQGLTATDIIQLEPKDIRLQEGLIYVPGHRRSNERVLPLEAVQIMGMVNYLQTGREKLNNNALHPSEKLFFNTEGGSHINGILAYVIHELKAYEPRLQSSLHIRASVITKWLKKYNLRKAQYLAGHRYISSTEKYLVNDLEGLQEEINQFHPLG